MKNKIIYYSTLTCPHCGHKQKEKMPEDSCAFFYECPQCGMILRPKEGDCCVYCSYGDVPCPPVQKANLENGKPSCDC